ncbi:alpha/beta hydrolase [Aeromicrobium erythreum]|uniref:alpha/beta hydrolase n=1 Tax=Aeromicrobium erythreum TaxID=2041 RepID=UPI0008313495|nr:alpha/beta hydrolase [Aeromicrobium erythreum]
MGLYADATALLMNLTAPLTVRYGDALQLVRDEVDDPSTWRVPTRHGQVRCFVYRPRPGRRAAPSTPGAYVHLHGGAFLMRHAAMDDFFARWVVATTGAVVVNVDYDVAPRHRYPVAQEQAHDVLRWVQEHGHERDVDGTRVVVGGFSAGGNLAASACLQARDAGEPPVRLQLLGVPSLDVSTTVKPATIPRPMIDERIVGLVRATYFKDAARRTEPYASPLLADDVSGLAPALVLTAQHDALRAEGDAYAQRLSDAGVAVEHHVVPGQDHYFLDPGDLDQARHWMRVMSEAILRALD